MNTKDYCCPATLYDFVEVMQYGNPDSIVFNHKYYQVRLLDYLICLLNDKSENVPFHPAFFTFAGVEEFFEKLFIALELDLNNKVEEVFQQCLVYTAGFVNCPANRQVIHRLLAKLMDRFPHLKSLFAEQFGKISGEFFHRTLEEYLLEHKTSLDEFVTKFPNIYELFITPLISETVWNHKLFNFYCNPCIYSPILSYITKPYRSHVLAEVYDKRLEEPNKCLEERLQIIRTHTTEESWQVLTKKAQELVKTSNLLEPFAVASSSLLGEINTAFTLIKENCESNDLLIFLPDDNLMNTKHKRRNCDLMIIRFKGNDRILIEVKTKTPRHGVDDKKINFWDDFFSNFSGAIDNYLQYLDQIIFPIFGLNLRNCFSLFGAHEGCSYGTALPLINQFLVSSTFDANSDKKLNSEAKSAEKIEHLLRRLFLRPLELENDCAPLAPIAVRLIQRCHATIQTLQKEWVVDLMRDKVAQIKVAYERQIEEGHKVSKLYVAVDLSLSYRLLQDPFSNCDGNVKDIAVDQLQVVFQPFKDEFTKRGIDLELLVI